jgi:hypothetical protein
MANAQSSDIQPPSLTPEEIINNERTPESTTRSSIPAIQVQNENQDDFHDASEVRKSSLTPPQSIGPNGENSDISGSGTPNLDPNQDTKARFDDHHEEKEREKEVPSSGKLVKRSNSAPARRVTSKPTDITKVGHSSTTNSRFKNGKPLGSSRKRRRFGRHSIPIGPLRTWGDWERKGREPYHAYVHKLVESGWNNLSGLDGYLGTDVEDGGLVISVLDITDDYRYVRRDDIRDEVILKQYLEQGRPADVRVRLYLAEQLGTLASGVIDAFGSTLKIDPRFFQQNIFGNKHVISPSERHRAKFATIGFTVPNEETTNATDTHFFRVSTYVQPDDVGAGWNGIILFNSHLRMSLSVHEFVAPPEFGSPVNQELPAYNPSSRTFREMYIASFPFINMSEAANSPFYAIHFLLRLNYYCWAEIISAIRAEDEAQNGISENSVDHVEEIQKTLSLVQRGGSLGWANSNSLMSLEQKTRLEEDFKHLLDQADLLWEARRKRAQIYQKGKDARATALTNSFTYIFVPLSLVSSIYGMNVFEISKDNDNPPIWQFFVVSVGFGLLIVSILGIYHFINVHFNDNRRPGFKEIFGFAFGRNR